jgi:hypothetical protein
MKGKSGMSDEGRPPEFYRVIPFPILGHWLLRLDDRSYASQWTSRLTGGSQQDVEFPATLELAISNPGKPMDLSLTAMGVLVASSNAKRVLESVAIDDIHLIPAPVKGYSDGYWVVDIRSSVDTPAVDFIADIEIDPARVQGQQIFRLTSVRHVVMVTDRLRRALIDANLVVAGFVPCGSVRPTPLSNDTNS